MTYPRDRHTHDRFPQSSRRRLPGQFQTTRSSDRKSWPLQFTQAPNVVVFHRSGSAVVSPRTVLKNFTLADFYKDFQ